LLIRKKQCYVVKNTLLQFLPTGTAVYRLYALKVSNNPSTYIT